MESGAGMRALSSEGSKGVSWRGCGPSSFVMDVFILKTKVPFSAGTAGAGQEKCLGGHGDVLRSLVQAFPQSPGFLLKVICAPKGSGRNPKRVLFRWERGKTSLQNLPDLWAWLGSKCFIDRRATR